MIYITSTKLTWTTQRDHVFKKEVEEKEERKKFQSPVHSILALLYAFSLPASCSPKPAWPFQLLYWLVSSSMAITVVKHLNKTTLSRKGCAWLTVPGDILGKSRQELETISHILSRTERKECMNACVQLLFSVIYCLRPHL